MKRNVGDQVEWIEYVYAMKSMNPEESENLTKMHEHDQRPSLMCLGISINVVNMYTSKQHV